MGREIARARFKYYDFHRFEKLLRHEMEVLHQWFRDGRFSDKRAIGGVELETWLVDADCRPVPWNEQVIATAGSPDIVTELSRFNVEFNVAPQPLAECGLAELVRGLGAIWQQCDAAAGQLGASVLSIGILPTVDDSMLSLKNMSNLNRYRALNEQVLRLRQGRPIRLEVKGQETLVTEHRDVMLESAATSFQLHLQVPFAEAVRYFNASLVASAPMVAVASNSPLLFGKLLWEETRIPVFEQAVDVGSGSLPRVTFGPGYARECLWEVFCENQSRYPVLLPLAMDEASPRLDHLRLQNGTIWRWNRPLIGFDDDDTPHLRIEHRVMAAGPTLVDMAANMVLFYGLVESLAHDPRPPESCLSFRAARANFYRAAQVGLNADVQWLDGHTTRLGDLLLAELLPRAEAGLRRLQVDPSLAATWLEIVAARVRSGQTGSVWQKRFLERHESDYVALSQAYRHQQQRGEPVHRWTFDRSPPTEPVRMRRSMLQIVSELPRGLRSAHTTDLADVLGRPTLIHLPGRRPEPLFLSIMLHGDEEVGLRALQRFLDRHGERPLPRSLSIFIGNVAAAKAGMRNLPHQPDYNRVWPGSERYNSPEHALMRHVVAEMRQRRVFASIDLHNNTGWNPHYACVTRLDWVHLQLAALFGRTAVYFQRPVGVQTMAFADFAPSVTCECGQIGDESGVQHAADFLDACLHLAEVPQHPVADGDLHLFRTVATICVPARIDFTFESTGASACPLPFDLALREDLDRCNFQELAAGTHLGWSRTASPAPLTVIDESGSTVTDEFLGFEQGEVRLRRAVIPAMLTRNQTMIRQECLGYFMERSPLPK